MIELNNLYVGYHKSTLIENIHLRCEKGKTVALLGRNGSGKSTLLKTVCGLVQPLKGKVLIDNCEVLADEKSSLSVAAVFQFDDRIPHTEVYTFISFGRYNNTGALGRLKKVDYEYVDYIIKLMKLEKLINKSFNKLSDGEKQKILIARALAQDTRLVILDEPTAFLDIINRNELFKLVVDLAKNMHKTFIISTHDLDMAIKYADEFWMINNGKLIQMQQSAVIKKNINNIFDLTD